MTTLPVDVGWVQYSQSYSDKATCESAIEDNKAEIVMDVAMFMGVDSKTGKARFKIKGKLKKKSKMLRKQWKKNKDREYIVGPCKWCEKEIVNTDSFVTFADKTRACIKCHRNSGHMLPFWDKEHSK